MVGAIRLAARALPLVAALITTPAAAITYTGTLAGNFSEFLPISPFDFDTRPLRISFLADLSEAQDLFLSFDSDLYFEGTFDNGPGEPRDWYGDQIPRSENYSSLLSPTGFSLVIDTADNVTCSPYKPPAYFCEHVYPTAFYLDGEIVGTSVAYSFSVTAVPEPTVWALMIAGLGLVGIGIRRRRATSIASSQT